MEDLTRVYFKSPYGDTGYLDISNVTSTSFFYTIPFNVQNVKGGTFTVDLTTTVYLQPNQLAYAVTESKKGNMTYMATHYAGGDFVNQSVYTDIPSTFSIGAYGVQNIQFRYYSLSAYQKYCQNRAQSIDPACTYHTMSGPYTIPIVNQGVLTTNTNPGNTIPFDTYFSSDGSNITWWFVLILGIVGIAILLLIILAGSYAFGRFRQPVYVSIDK